MKNIKYLINIVPFLTVIFSLFYLNIFTARDTEVSLTENRKLADMPKFSIQALKSGEYFAGLDAYISDNFFNREAFAINNRKLNGIIHTNIFTEKDFSIYIKPAMAGENAIAMKNENVFFVVKNNLDSIQKYCDVINGYKSAFNDLPLNVLISPTKYEFIDDKRLKENDEETQKDALDFAKSSLDKKINYINVYDKLAKHKDEYLYFKTDHHWTSLGAYYAYNEFAVSQGITPIDLEKYPLIGAGEFTGSFLNITNDERVSNIKDEISIYIPKSKYSCSYDWEKSRNLTNLASFFDMSNSGYRIFMGGDYGFAKIETENKGDTILIIKDSYANALIQYLIEHYSRIIIVDPRYFKEKITSVIRKENVDSILFVNNIEALSDPDFINNLTEIL